jgi:hypothetical protein
MTAELWQRKVIVVVFEVCDDTNGEISEDVPRAVATVHGEPGITISMAMDH